MSHKKSPKFPLYFVFCILILATMVAARDEVPRANAVHRVTLSPRDAYGNLMDTSPGQEVSAQVDSFSQSVEPLLEEDVPNCWWIVTPLDEVELANVSLPTVSNLALSSPASPPTNTVKSKTVAVWCDNGHARNVSSKSEFDSIASGLQSSTSVKAKLYSLENKNGSQLHILGAGSCLDSQYWLPNIGSAVPAWNNVASSGESIGPCGTLTGWDLTNYAGPRIDCTPYCNVFYAMNNKITSLKVKS